MSIRTYNELMTIPTFEERFEYLKLNGRVGETTFGFDRFMNQQFYRSKEWKRIRDKIIVRDMGCDLACTFNPFDYEIKGMIVIHHMNPISVDDLQGNTDFLLNPNYLVCVSDPTHRAIHLGDKKFLPSGYKPRTLFDTCPWKC